MNCGSYLYNFQYCKYKFFPLEQIYTYKLNMFGLTGISLFDCLTFDLQMKNSFQLCKKCGIEANCNIKENIFVTPKILIFLFIKNINSQNIKFFIEEKIDENAVLKNKFADIQLLIGLKENEDLKELNAILQ